MNQENKSILPLGAPRGILPLGMARGILHRARGVRDFEPAVKRQRDRVVLILKNVFELYGFQPLETPILERYELFASKFAQGEESDAMKETFKIKDQGERDLVLRNDLTVPFARFVGANPNLKMPFKRYQIGEVFRDGPIKLGRYREFYQCDVDVVGSASMKADAELVMIAKQVFKKLELPVVIYVNNRKILNSLMEKAGIAADKRPGAIISLDKLSKIGEKEVRKEMAKRGVDKKQADQLLKLVDISGGNNEKLAALKKALGEADGVREMAELLDYLPDDKDVLFEPTLARGLGYYTGPVFEVFLKDKSMSSSVAGGGRYDEMISKFLGDGRQYPATGISFGLEAIMDVLAQKKNQSVEPAVEVYVIPLGEKCVKYAFEAAELLRANGIKTDIDVVGRSFRKNLDYANDLKIPKVIVAGEDEMKEGVVSVKDMESGEQRKVEMSGLVEYFGLEAGE